MLISFLRQLRPLFESSSVGLEAAPAVSMGNPALTWGRCVWSPGAAGEGAGWGLPSPQGEAVGPVTRMEKPHSKPEEILQ